MVRVNHSLASERRLKAPVAPAPNESIAACRAPRVSYEPPKAVYSAKSLSLVSRNVQSLANDTTNSSTRRIKSTWLKTRTEDIIMIQETWGHEVAVTGYQVFRKSRNHMRGGGVATYIKEGLRGKVINDRIADTLILLVENGSTNARSGLLLVNVYMPPSSVNQETRETREGNITREITRIRATMDSLIVILAGDINPRTELKEDFLSLKRASPLYVTHRHDSIDLTQSMPVKQFKSQNVKLKELL